VMNADLPRRLDTCFFPFFSEREREREREGENRPEQHTSHTCIHTERLYMHT